ncbi:hypothetical protein BH24ACT14_BH24ACT14_11150 [soil metagenome]
MGEQLEDALAEAEAELAAAAKTVAALTAELRKGRAKATTGELRDLRKALQNVAELGAAVHDRTAAVARMWRFDDEEHLASGAWRAEVLRHAEGAGVQVFEQEDRLVSYPVLVTVQPGSGTIKIDKKSSRRLRPSYLVKELAALQQRQPAFKPQAFLESLAEGYDRQVAIDKLHDGAVVHLIDVHKTLTLLPGQSREYGLAEFARDLFLLDSSDTIATKAGRRISLPASTTTKGKKVLRTVTRNGQPKEYAGVSFS